MNNEEVLFEFNQLNDSVNSILKNSPTRKVELNAFGKPKKRIPKSRGVEFKREIEDVKEVENWKKYNQNNEDGNEEKVTKCKCLIF